MLSILAFLLFFSIWLPFQWDRILFSTKSSFAGGLFSLVYFFFFFERLVIHEQVNIFAWLLGDLLKYFWFWFFSWRQNSPISFYLRMPLSDTFWVDSRNSKDVLMTHGFWPFLTKKVGPSQYEQASGTMSPGPLPLWVLQWRLDIPDIWLPWILLRPLHITAVSLCLLSLESHFLPVKSVNTPMKMCEQILVSQFITLSRENICIFNRILLEAKH